VAVLGAGSALWTAVFKDGRSDPVSTRLGSREPGIRCRPRVDLRHVRVFKLRTLPSNRAADFRGLPFFEEKITRG